MGYGIRNYSAQSVLRIEGSMSSSTTLTTCALRQLALKADDKLQVDRTFDDTTDRAFMFGESSRLLGVYPCPVAGESLVCATDASPLMAAALFQVRGEPDRLVAQRLDYQLANLTGTRTLKVGVILAKEVAGLAAGGCTDIAAARDWTQSE
jgi:hypothetical protein